MVKHSKDPQKEMKSVVIARHAKSDWATGLPDHDRPLNHRGKEDAPRMGRALKALGFQPEVILSSTALRARTTANAVALELGLHSPVKTDASLYEASHGQVVNSLQQLPDSVNHTMVFGHNPTLEQVVAYLLKMDGGIVLPTSGMVCLEAPISSWSELRPGICALRWFLIPKLLP